MALIAARCRFPARETYLAAKLGFDPARLPARTCPKRDEFLGRVANPQLPKPFAPQELREAVRGWLAAGVASG